MDAERKLASELDILLDSALDHEASLRARRRWKPNAHKAVTLILHGAVARLITASNNQDRVAFEPLFEAVCVLFEDAVDALMEHPDAEEAHVFVDGSHEFISDLRTVVSKFPRGMVDQVSFKQAIQELYKVLGCLGRQLN